MMKLKEQLRKMNACSEAEQWVGDRTLEQAWAECERGDWMLWFASTMKVDHRKLTLAKALCAKLVIHRMKDERSRNAVAAAERYGRGRATREELRAAAAAAGAAGAAAAAAAAAGAARKEKLSKCADICREVLTDEILKRGE